MECTTVAAVQPTIMTTTAVVAAALRAHRVPVEEVEAEEVEVGVG